MGIHRARKTGQRKKQKSISIANKVVLTTKAEGGANDELDFVVGGPRVSIGKVCT